MRSIELARAGLGLVGHTHVAAAWRQTPRGAEAARIRVGEPLDLARRTATWQRATYDPVPARLRAPALGDDEIG